MFIGVIIINIVIYTLNFNLIYILTKFNLFSNAMVEVNIIESLAPCLIFNIRALAYKSNIFATYSTKAEQKVIIESISSSIIRKAVADMESEFILYFKDILKNKKEIYKQLKGKSGVYLFINNINLKLYVGSSITLDRRLRAHIHYATTSNSNKNQILYRAIKNYKLENFSLAILEFCYNDLILCAEVEQK